VASSLGLRVYLRDQLEFARRALAYWRLYGTVEFTRFSWRFAKDRLWPSQPPPALDHVILDHAKVATTATPAGTLFHRPKVLLVAELSVPQCRQYRVLQKIRVFGQRGIAHELASWRDGHAVLNGLQDATAVLFYRVPDGPELRLYLGESERLGVKRLYDLDDPVFSVDVMRANSNLNYLRAAERQSFVQGAPRFLAAMRQCDLLLGSTPALCELMTNASGREALLWRNLFDPLSAPTAAHPQHRQPIPGPVPTAGAGVRLAYASGSRAHEADFRLISTVLASLMDQHRRLELHVLGYLQLPKILTAYSSRIRQHPFQCTERYFFTLARMDIAVVPLLPNPFNETKSAVRFLEASVLALPTVASAVGDYRHLIRHGETGFLARDPGDWQGLINALICSPDLRKRIGDEARAFVLSEMTIRDEHLGQHIDPSALAAIHGEILDPSGH
jgi:hypothetical protein